MVTKKASVSEINTVIELSITSKSCIATVVKIILLCCFLGSRVHAVSVHLQTLNSHS